MWSHPLVLTGNTAFEEVGDAGDRGNMDNTDDEE